MFTISYQGLNAGLVVCVADDPGMHSSQNEQDSRHYAEAAKVPMLEPADSEEARVFAKRAYELSEKFNTPVFLKMCTRVAHSQSVVNTEERIVPEQVPYKKDPTKVMMTKNSRDAHVRVEQRTKDLIAFAENCDLNRVEMGDTSIGFITSSTSYQYAKEVYGDNASYLKLGMIWPLPEKLILDFAEHVDKVVVLEELDPFIENHCRKLGLEVVGKETFPICGEFSQNLVRTALGGDAPEELALADEIPGRPPVMCAGCPHRGIFYILSKLKCMVYGDIGCYTLGAVAPLSVIDTTMCMGSSISTLHGMEKAKGKEYIKNWVAVIGDSTFMHTGVNSLMNMVYNKANGTVIIMDNSTTGMTGHQDHSATGKTLQGDPTYAIDIPELCHAVGVKHVNVVNAFDIELLQKTIKEEVARDEVSVIITKTPCVLLDKRKKPLYLAHEDQCKKCGLCMKPGCPAMTKNADGSVHIDDTMCTGCGLCEKLCKFNVIELVKEGE